MRSSAAALGFACERAGIGGGLAVCTSLASKARGARRSPRRRSVSGDLTGVLVHAAQGLPISRWRARLACLAARHGSTAWSDARAAHLLVVSSSLRRTLVCVGVMTRKSLDCVRGVLTRELLVEEDIGGSARGWTEAMSVARVLVLCVAQTSVARESVVLREPVVAVARMNDCLLLCLNSALVLQFPMGTTPNNECPVLG